MRTSFNISDDLLPKFDHTWKHEGMESRSRAVREAMSEYIEGHTQLEAVSGETTTVLAFDYEHEQIIKPLHDVQHDFQNVIEATSHMHQGDWCLETVFCNGEASRVRELVYQLRDFDTVGRVKVLILSPQAEGCHHTH